MPHAAQPWIAANGSPPYHEPGVQSSCGRWADFLSRGKPEGTVLAAEPSLGLPSRCPVSGLSGGAAGQGPARRLLPPGSRPSRAGREARAVPGLWVPTWSRSRIRRSVRAGCPALAPHASRAAITPCPPPPPGPSATRPRASSRSRTLRTPGTTGRLRLRSRRRRSICSSGACSSACR